MRSFEGAAGGLMFVCLLLSGFYVATERCRTRPVAIALLLLTLLAGEALNLKKVPYNIESEGMSSGIWIFLIYTSIYFPKNLEKIEVIPLKNGPFLKKWSIQIP